MTPPTAYHANVDVALGARSYPIFIGDGIIAATGKLAADTIAGRHAVIIADSAVDGLWRPRLMESIAPVAAHCDHLTVPSGEASKSLDGYAGLMERILALNVDRNTILFALGGGVIGDLAGFAAATLLRGVDYIQIPTTLLAMVDSAVGGKTGINAGPGKNLVGAFHQPRAVIADTACLGGLEARELRAGYAEVVKYALLGDAGFFTRLEGEAGELLAARSPVLLADIIAHCCRAKAAIVAEDEHETDGGRALLNLGHTFGHAYEAIAGYDGTVLHGEAVAAGMCDAFRLAARLGFLGDDDTARVIRHLEAMGLPTARGQLGARVKKTSSRQLLEAMRGDKKAAAGKITLILPHAIGAAKIEKNVAESDIIAILDASGKS